MNDEPATQHINYRLKVCHRRAASNTNVPVAILSVGRNLWLNRLCLFALKRVRALQRAATRACVEQFHRAISPNPYSPTSRPLLCTVRMAVLSLFPLYFIVRSDCCKSCVESTSRSENRLVEREQCGGLIVADSDENDKNEDTIKTMIKLIF